MKKVLVQEGFAEQLANVVSTCKDATGDEILKQRTQSAADMIVMLLTEGQYLIFILLQLFIVVFFYFAIGTFCKQVFLGEKSCQEVHGFINPLTPKISLVILLPVSFSICMMLVWRIWNWINK